MSFSKRPHDPPTSRSAKGGSDSRRLLHVSSALRADERWGGELADALRLARRYVRYSPRSTAHLRAYLQDRGVAHHIVQAVVVEAIRKGWLGDRACAKLWARHFADRGYARAAIQERLHLKGFEAQVVSDILASLQPHADDATRAREVVCATLQRWRGRRPASRGDHDQRARLRVARVLAQRGFDSDLIDRVLTESFGPATATHSPE